MVKSFLNVVSIFYFNLSSPSGIATCTALYAIRRFRRQYCSRSSNQDKYTLLLYIIKRFLEVEVCFMSQAHANTYVTLFERVPCPLLFKLKRYQIPFCNLPKGISYRMQNPKKSAKIKGCGPPPHMMPLQGYCMR
jgi:hypothetical protein